MSRIVLFIVITFRRTISVLMAYNQQTMRQEAHQTPQRRKGARCRPICTQMMMGAFSLGRRHAVCERVLCNDLCVQNL